MALIVPSGPQWAYNTSNLAATPTHLLGTSVTAGASNADGATVTLLPALTHDVEYLRIGFNGFIYMNADCSALLDILIDPAGGTNWSSLIDDLLVGFTAACATSGAPSGPCNWYDFPLWIPAGASIGARARTAAASSVTGNVAVFARGGNGNPASWWCGQQVRALGVDAAASHGTFITPGTAPSWSAWTNVGSALDLACGAVQFWVQGPGAAAGAYSNKDHWQIGVGGTAIGPAIAKLHTSGEASWSTPTGPIWADLPAGTQLQARGMTDAFVTPVAIDAGIYTVH